MPDSQQRLMLVLLAVLAVPCAAQQQPQYAYTAVGLSPLKSVALSISNSGNVTGVTQSDSQAFLYSAGTFTELGTLPGENYSQGRGVNDAGQVVGLASNNDGNSRAFLYSNGSMTDLGSLDNSDSDASGINDAGEIVGVSRVGMHWRAFRYRQGVMTALGTLPGTASNSMATAINRSGQITGSSDYDPYNPWNYHFQHAILYENGVMKDLGSVGGDNSIGNAINDHGQVAGKSMVIPGNGSLEHAFLYADGVMRDLGTPIAGTSSDARGINNLGQVVGVYTAGNGRAFLYQKSGGMRDLTSMVDPASGWYIHAANGINDRQQIVALGCKDGQYGAVLLNPTYRDGLIADGPGTAAASASPMTIGAPENPQCGHG